MTDDTRSSSGSIFLWVGIISLLAVFACLAIMLFFLPTISNTAEQPTPTGIPPTRVIVVATETPIGEPPLSVVDIIATSSLPEEPLGFIRRPASVFIPEDVSCSPLPTCQEMRSCGEAIAYATRCGINDYDPDNDGIVCENLCSE